MTNEALRRVRRAIHRQAMREHQRGVARGMAFTYGRLGGWIGKREEVMRFLCCFSLWRETHDVSERFFTANWPHHEAGYWYAARPDCRN